MWVFVILASLFLLASCTGTPDGGCQNSVTGSDITVTQACGGSGDHASGSVQTPAPVVVPPVVINNPPAEGS